MPSPITSQDFELANFSGDVCEKLNALLTQMARMKDWFEYAFNVDGTPTEAFLQDFDAIAVPVGAIEFMPVNTVPNGRLLANGTAVRRSDYPRLFAVYGTFFGPGDGATTFNLPNMQNLVPRGWGSGSPGQIVGADSVSFQIDPTNLPEHSHEINVEQSSETGDSATGVLKADGGIHTQWSGSDTDTARAHTLPEGDVDPVDITISTVQRGMIGLWVVKF